MRRAACLTATKYILCFILLPFEAAVASSLISLTNVWSYEPDVRLSPDGSTVISEGFINSTKAKKWTAENGWQSLGFLPGGDSSFARAASYNGSVIVGASKSFAAPGGWEAFRWEQGTGMESLGLGIANGVSADGSVVVGRFTQGLDSGVVWKEGQGLIGPTSAPPGSSWYWATGTSADGNIIVGERYPEPNSTFGYGGFVWSESDGYTLLNFRPTDISSDGSTVVGGNYIWTKNDGAQLLGQISQFNDLGQLAVSGDGSIVVGADLIWREGKGLQSFNDVLKNEYYIDASNWKLVAQDISDDGRVITGTGIDYSSSFPGSVNWLIQLDKESSGQHIAIPLQYTPPPPPIVTPIITPDVVSSKPTVVITHGWQPSLLDSTLTVPDWMLDMKYAIGKDANVILNTWETAITGYLGFQEALAEVATQGRKLGAQLLAWAEREGSQVLDHLHFVGHSLGTYVNAYAADFLTRAGYTVEQFTILDRPFGNGLAAVQVDGVPVVGGSGFDTPIFQQLLQKDKVLWVDNYYGDDIFSLTPAFGASFDGEGPTAVNWLVSGANHTQVHEWYACLMGVSGDGCLFVSGPDEVIAGVGYRWSLSGGRSDWRPEIAWDPGTYVGVWDDLDPVRWLQYNCHTELGVVRCAEGSPAFLWNEEFYIPMDAEFLKFDFRWTNLGDGDYMSVFFDDTLLFNDLGSAFFGDDFINSGLIPIGAFSGMTGRLLFALNSVGESNASFEIANIEILRRSIPEPGTLLLVGIGLAALIVKRRYRREF